MQQKYCGVAQQVDSDKRPQVLPNQAGCALHQAPSRHTPAPFFLFSSLQTLPFRSRAASAVTQGKQESPGFLFAGGMSGDFWQVRRACPAVQAPASQAVLCSVHVKFCTLYQVRSAVGQGAEDNKRTPSAAPFPLQGWSWYQRPLKYLLVLVLCSWCLITHQCRATERTVI